MKVRGLKQFNFETLLPALYGETSLLSSSVSCCAATAEARYPLSGLPLYG
jgi:hypothetical protein